MTCTISQIYIGKELYMFWTDLLSIIRSPSTVYPTTGICHTSYVDCLLARSGWILPSPAWQIPIAVRTVLRLLMMDSRSETCRVLYQNKFEK